MSSSALDHERLISLIGSMVDGVLALDDKLAVVTYNGAALNILDINGSLENKQLRDVLKLYNQNDQPIDIEELVRSTKTSTSNRDFLMHYSDGSRANMYLSIAPVRLGYGATGEKGYVLMVRDITREKSLEEERDEFISVVSHELRTPIAIAEGNNSNATFMPTQGVSMASIKDALETAHQKVILLASMINDLSTLSRAERGVLSVEVEAINAHELVEELVKAHSLQAGQKALALRADLDPHLETLYSSRLYVREILQNFLTNAIKYTQVGSVVISAKSAGQGVIFSVSDTGIGISKADKDRVFDRFFRSEDYRTRATNGTGLGLYVTLKLARLIHADIDVQSELDHGSVFTISVPNLAMEQTPPSATIPDAANPAVASPPAQASPAALQSPAQPQTTPTT